MAEQILLPVSDAQRIAELLREVESDEEASFYADLLEEHATDHSFEDHFTDIGPIDEVVEAAKERASQ
ncbi:hypothetical protein C440_02508 [Haloferax mucosum ATCC BAA-1512]|uniref:Uncharacterized protein n=1 Tax=Haloferax mucosum ATCC BAA-1512 TaxID=662479 RepID=M0IQI9_9EURY|nr:hypothetical protein [Haloferax mucosum]ELZ98083.1 hypothetical protein C440_02508 [Haloferax mucosum ATCC BAA-1512]